MQVAPRFGAVYKEQPPLEILRRQICKNFFWKDSGAPFWRRKQEYFVINGPNDKDLDRLDDALELLRLQKHALKLALATQPAIPNNTAQDEYNAAKKGLQDLFAEFAGKAEDRYTPTAR